jgi:transposase-like protein
MTRKTFTSEFKSKVAIEALKGHKTVNELACEFDVHPAQISLWKKQLVESSKSAFNDKKQQANQRSLEEEREQLYAQIGKLKVELDWLKKKIGHRI